MDIVVALVSSRNECHHTFHAPAPVPYRLVKEQHWRYSNTKHGATQRHSSAWESLLSNEGGHKGHLQNVNWPRPGARAERGRPTGYVQSRRRSYLLTRSDVF